MRSAAPPISCARRWYGHEQEHRLTAPRRTYKRCHGLKPDRLVEADRPLVERGHAQAKGCGGETLPRKVQPRCQEPAAQPPARHVRPHTQADVQGVVGVETIEMASRDLRRRAKTEEAYDGALLVGRRIVRSVQHLTEAVVQVVGIGVIESV